ncbi:MAG: hypothetical protein K9L70_08765 [Thiohalocapsa sp.]|jgi:hypothetical protein|nr:hypothetical protein [Thiohalocapsa sp.]MCF7989545.1 hypothetical protein [Thiohalocapsa sp.]
MDLLATLIAVALNIYVALHYSRRLVEQERHWLARAREARPRTAPGSGSAQASGAAAPAARNAIRTAAPSPTR